MSDQMPDEVWLDDTEPRIRITQDGSMVWTPNACYGTRYIRADLYEISEADLDAVGETYRQSASSLQRQLSEAQADRDRLRAAVIEVLSWHPPRHVQVTLQEALGHD